MTPWSIRPTERRLTAALAGYLFLVIAALYLMKPARNALFLEDLGADRLPWVYIVTAFVTWWIVVAYVGLAGRTGLARLVPGTLAATIASLGGFWYLLTAAPAAGALAFYVWVKVYAVLLPSQFWLLSEEYLDPRQARRLFGPIGAGGVLGGIVGSAAAAGLAGVVGTRALLFIAAFAVVVAFFVFRWVVTHATPVRLHAAREGGRVGASPSAGERAYSGAGAAASDPAAGDSSAPPGRSLVLTIAAILIIATTAHTIVDWQFNKAAEAAIESQDARTAFFGAFFTALNVLTLVTQMVVTSTILRVFGIGVAISLLPIAIASGAVGILLFPGLWAASFARGADDSLRFSVDQSGRELLFLSFSSAERHRLKPRIDLIASRAANGIAGVIILAALYFLDDPLRYLSVVSLLLVGVWAGVVVRARRQYAATLQRLLQVRDPDIGRGVTAGLDADARNAVRQSLLSDDSDTVRAALALAEHTDPAAFVEELRRLLRTFEDTGVKSHALRLLTEAHDRSSLDEALANVDPAEEDLTAEALAYASSTGDADARRQILEYLQGPEPLLAIAAAVSLLEHQDPAQEAAGIEILVRAARVDTARGVELKLAVADVVRQNPGMDELRPILEILLADEAPQVVRAALTACSSRPHRDLVGPIAEAGTRRNLEGPALQALQAFGDKARGPLTGILADPRNRRDLRCFAARALGRVGGTGSAAGLIAGLVAEDRKVRRATLKALNYMRRRGERLDLGREREAAAIAIEWNDYLTLLVLAAALGKPATSDPTAFVATVVGERLQEAEEQLFRALALRHPIQAVFFAYRGLITGDRSARGHAIELIDSILETPERRTLVRILDTHGRLARGYIAAQELGGDIPTTEEALRRLLDPGDPWMAACAIRALGADSSSIPVGLRQELVAHDYPPLSELLGDEV